MSELDFYNSFHTHNINKLIHIVCIPMLMFSTINFVSLFKIVGTSLSGCENKLIISFDTLLYYYYAFLYMYKFGRNQTWFQLSLTMSYLTVVHVYAYYYRIVNHVYTNNSRLSRWQKNNIKIFIFAWIMQFIGHYIEGSSPALFIGLKQTFLYAPIFSLNSLITVIN